MKTLLTLLAILLVPVAALAQAASAPADLPLDEALKQLVGLVAQFKGASALGIAVLVTQAIMKLAQSPLGNLAGKWKLVIVCGVSIVSTYLGLVFAGASWGASLLAGPLVGALQVFAHQLYLNFKPQTPAE